MAGVKANGILKWIVMVFVGALVFIGVYAFKGRNSSSQSINTQPDTVVYDLTESEQKELGFTAGDTPHDTLKTLLGAVKQTRADVKAVREENEKLKRENSFLKSNANDVSQQIAAAFEHKEAEIDRKLALLNKEQDTFSKDPVAAEQNYPIGRLGLEGEPNTQAPSLPLAPSVQPQNTTKWVEPSDVIYKDKQGNVLAAGAANTIPTYPNPFKALDESPLGQAADNITKENSSSTGTHKKNIVPFFTVPQNSTFLDAISMTALIGRVPIDGGVTDPYPFKILVGKENLMANGIELPNIEGAIVSGVATGDWTLSCVRGKVENMTFIFSDGRIASSQDTKNNDKGIGWISNISGVQCVAGERKTNAPEYLTSQFLLAGAGAAAQGLAQGQTTTVVDGNSVIGAVTGNQGKFILGQALGGGLKETTDWLRQRYGQTFDAIYAPPGQSIAIHITQELKIDYNPNGRKVNYQRTHSTQRLD